MLWVDVDGTTYYMYLGSLMNGRFTVAQTTRAW